ncbi:hypothetical protein MKW92_048102, partial [Papaver armeniacum]
KRKGGEGVSFYVRNLASTVTDSKIEQELKQFGSIKPDGVAIRFRQMHQAWILVFAMHLLNMKMLLVLKLLF